MNKKLILLSLGIIAFLSTGFVSTASEIEENPAIETQAQSIEENSNMTDRTRWVLFPVSYKDSKGNTGSLHRYDKVELIETAESECKVLYNGNEVYVPENCLSESSTITENLTIYQGDGNYVSYTIEADDPETISKVSKEILAEQAETNENEADEDHKEPETKSELQENEEITEEPETKEIVESETASKNAETNDTEKKTIPWKAIIGIAILMTIIVICISMIRKNNKGV